MNERKRRWVVLGWSGLAFFLRAAGLGFQSLWRDEVDAVRFALAPFETLLHTFAEPGQNGPLYFLLLRPWLELAGQSEFALRFFSLFWGVMAVPLIYRLGRRLFPGRPAVGLIAAGLAATSPYLVWYSQEGKMYALLVVLVLLSMDRYLAAVEQGGWQRWLGYVLATSAALYVHLAAALILPVQVLLFFFVSRQARTWRWKPWLASLAALTLPYLPLLAWQLPLLLEPAQTGYLFVSLPDMLLSMFSSYSHGVLWGGTWLTLALFLGLLLAPLLFLRRGAPELAPLGVLLCWLLLPGLGLFLITLVRPIYTARYLIFAVPALLLLLAAGVMAGVRRSWLLGGLLLAALVAINGWGLWLQATTPLKADFRAATAYLTGHQARDDLLLFQIPYGRHSFDYYYHQQALAAARSAGEAAPVGEYRLFLPWLLKEGDGPGLYRWADGPYTNAGLAPDELDRRMIELLAGGRVVWLVATEPSLWDERGLVQAWLEAHGRRIDEAHFVRVDLYRYEIP